MRAILSLPCVRLKEFSTMTRENGSLSNQVVLITGAGSGVGGKAAEIAAQNGAQVLCIDRDEPALIRTARVIREAGGRVLFRVADITQEDEISSTIKDLVAEAGGVLDSVLNVAGVMRGQRLPLEKFNLALWSEVILINLTGTFLVAKHALMNMNKDREGTIILVASRSGIFVPSGSLAYGASKGGIHGFAMSLEKQLSSSKIRVHTVCPGDMDTPLMQESLREAIENGADPIEVEKIRESLTNPSQVASVLIHLIHPAARGISGTVLAN